MWAELQNFIGRYVDKNWALVIILLAGGGAMSLLAWALGPQDSRPWEHILLDGAGSLGHTILAAGFFAAFLKMFQFIGVFKDAMSRLITNDAEFNQGIHKLMFSSDSPNRASFDSLFKGSIKDIIINDQVFRNNLRDILLHRDFLALCSLDVKREIWRNATYSIYDGSLPENGDSLLADKILKSYLPKSVEFIQKDFVVRYEVSYDGGDVVYKEKCSYDIIPLTEDAEFKTSYFVWRSMKEKDSSAITIHTFKFNDDDVKMEFASTTSQVQKKPGRQDFEVTKKTLNVPLKKKLGPTFSVNKAINVKSVIELRFTPIVSPSFRYTFSKYTLGFEIDYENKSPDDITVKLELFDDRLDLREILEDSTGLRNKNELLLPSDGYLLIVTPKKWNHEKHG
ncbi:MAG: hypothetical protein WDO14_11635 [Bacteroidota bacterium]